MVAYGSFLKGKLPQANGIGSVVARKRHFLAREQIYVEFICIIFFYLRVQIPSFIIEKIGDIQILWKNKTDYLQW
jgi:hypothetical protein